LPEIPLVIGNTESVNSTIARIVRSAGFEVEVFTSAEQFLGSGQIPNTGCLVLDVHPQGMSGFQPQSPLASASRHIPIIFVTTSADQSARAVALRAGAVNVLDNPSGSEALLREIRLVLKPGDQAGRTSVHSPGRNRP
jgi:FixJ family two-component response regulator